MRFVHLADIHFDAPFILLTSKENFGDVRRLEQREAFKKVIEYIKKNNIPYLFISGDLYEQAYVRKTTIEYINNLFKEIPDTKIFISPGNHDPFLKNSYYYNFDWNKNVYIFNNEIKKYEFDECDIYGFGFNDFYCNNSEIENIKIENKNKINILIAHGTLNASKTLEMQYNPINEKNIKKIGFNYVALGHIHKRDYYNNIVYPGSAISLGFDELGEHGMLDVELNKNDLNINFIKLDNIIFEEKEYDISEINSEEDLIEKINIINLEKNKYYKLILTGYRTFEINIEKILKLITQKNILKIENNTKLNFNIENIKNQNNLIGFSIKEILNNENKEKYSEKEIKNAIEIIVDTIQ